MRAFYLLGLVKYCLLLQIFLLSNSNVEIKDDYQIVDEYEINIHRTKYILSIKIL